MPELPEFVENYKKVATPHLNAPGSLDDPRYVNRVQRYFMTLAEALEFNYYDITTYTRTVGDAEITDRQKRAFTQFDTFVLQDEYELAAAIRKIGGGVVLSARFEKYDLTPEAIEAIEGIHEGNAALWREIR